MRLLRSRAHPFALLLAFAALGGGPSYAASGGATPAAAQPEPLWAYGYATPPAPGDKAIPQAPPSRALRPNEDAAEQTRPRSVAGSKAAYSLVDIRDAHTAVDWFPGEHPPMSEIIRHGPAQLGPAAKACALCHLPTGKGRPENAPVAGLPAAYFIRQLEDFKSGARASADPRKPNVPTMALLAAAMTPEEMKTAADYFGAMQWTPWTRVVETDFVPKTKLVNNMFLPLSTERTEPIGHRIVEVPEDEEQSEILRNPHSGFIAYVPTGSIARGKALVTTGNDSSAPTDKTASAKTVACTTCHGADLLGQAEVPGIAGRSPSYLVRQLYDFQAGTRHGPQAALMQPSVVHLTNDDFIAIAAYVTSLVPPGK
jgi:cytochrome c553